MKAITISIIIAVPLLMVLSANAGEVGKPQKFNATITIKYKDISLKELAEKEKEIKSYFDKAESVFITMEKECPSCPNSNWVPYVTPNLQDNIQGNVAW